MNNDDEIQRIRVRFAQAGYELVVHPVPHGGYFAPYMRADSQGGVAPFAWGQTGLEAAEKAWDEFQRKSQERE